MPIYEFKCEDCGANIGDYYEMSEAPQVGSAIQCVKCGGIAKRIFSVPQLRPEFFGITMQDSTDQPREISSRRRLEKFRRDEYIKATNGTKLQDTDGKLQYADNYSKQEMVKKQKARKERSKKALNDAYTKAEWGKRAK